MMARFYGYLDKVFQFRDLTARLTDSRRGSLNGIDKERHFPGRLRNFVGPRVPSGDTVGRVYAKLASGMLREVLRDVHLNIKRHKMLGDSSGWLFAAVDGHEFFRQPQTLLRPVPDARLDSGWSQSKPTVLMAMCPPPRRLKEAAMKLGLESTPISPRGPGRSLRRNRWTS
jgi:hypothetical protein